jgi:hypothetical protein
MYFSGVLAVMRNEDEDEDENENEDVEEDATSVRLAHTTEALRRRTCLQGPLSRAFIDITFFTAFSTIKNVYYTSF